MNRLSHFLVLAFLLNCGALYSFAQRTPSTVDRRFEEFRKQSEKSAHDDMQNEMNAPKLSKKEAQIEAARLRTEIREDLEGLQSGYNAMVVRLRDVSALESDFVRASAEKIYKHAFRFRSNIRLPKIDGSSEVSIGLEELKAPRIELKELCTKIYALLTSPMIDNPNVIDLTKAESMRKTLDSIILNSERLRNGPK